MLIIAAVAVSGLVVGQSWLSERYAAAKLQEAAKFVAVTMQRYVSSVAAGKKELIKVIADSALVHQALAGDDKDLMEADRALQKKLPEAAWVRLLPARGWDDEKIQKTLMGSFAAAEMYQQVREHGKVVPVEALKDSNGKQYFLLAVPVNQGGNLKGVLFAGFPMRLISAGLQGFESENMSLVLEQGKGLQLFTVGSSGIALDQSENLPVDGTLWHIRYSTGGIVGLSVPLLVGLAIGSIVLLLLAIYWAYQRLRRDYSADMGMMVALVDATLKRKGSVSQLPRLVESQPAVEILTRYAQATRTAAIAAEHKDNKAGQPSIVASDLEEPSADEPMCIPAEQLPESLFRSSLIRGRSGMDIDEEKAQAIGLVLGSMVQETGATSIYVGRDNRPGSDAYSASLIAGILASGCDATDVGMVPTPLLSFAASVSGTGSAVMVTGGHNAPDFNGFKIILEGKPISDEQLSELRSRLVSGESRRGVGELESRELSSEYIRALSEDVQLIESLKVVLDCGNGVTGSLATRALETLGCEVIPIFCESDGSYPNHPADPSNPQNMAALSAEVQAKGADMGLALDVDGDALAVVDEKGQLVSTDQLIMMLAVDIIRRHPGADIIYDVASSASLAATILANGGRPIMWKTGHGNMREKLEETGGLLAGEQSGHIYIKERWYGFDDGVYAAARLMEILSIEAVPVSSAFAEYAPALATPLIKLETPQGKDDQVVEYFRSKGNFSDADIVDMDGLRVEYSEAWGLIRASNTESALVFRFEASSNEALSRIQDQFRALLKEAAPELPAPF
ncbi:phosphomannomutase/phosphoglucomutase [Thiolapillus brandeum]|uniref:phosphomannomutase/phosphoglucomutase n=1 Tax=Thiolapillus brandeum TaxID=1076588 RepID=UPI00155A52C4|nr:phosphomannomutase/phosphoglucomutase [Thiolapillus brandeum]